MVANQFARAGFTLIKFNFSHNGTTPDKPEEFADLEAYAQNNYTKELDDLQAVIEWSLHPANEYKAAIDKNKLYLIGHSLGGGIVLIKAAEEPRVKSIATWASVSECKTPWGNWSQERMEEWKSTGIEYYTNSRTKQQLPLYYQLFQDYEQNKLRLDILQSVKRLNIPLLICHGNADDAVPVSSAFALHGACKTSELFLVESDHVFGRKHPWLEKELPKPMEAVVNKTIEFFQNASSSNAVST